MSAEMLNVVSLIYKRSWKAKKKIRLAAPFPSVHDFPTNHLSCISQNITIVWNLERVCRDLMTEWVIALLAV